jgi:hypothetical protein
VTMHGVFFPFFLCFHAQVLAHPFSRILMSWQVCGSGGHRVIFSPLCKEKNYHFVRGWIPFFKGWCVFDVAGLTDKWEIGRMWNRIIGVSAFAEWCEDGIFGQIIWMIMGNIWGIK